MNETEFPEDQWPELSARMSDKGPQAVIDYIRAFDDDLERRKLFAFAQQAFSSRDWPGKSLESLIAVVEAGIAEGLSAAAAASDSETRAQRIDFANILAYNLAADLAECWPGDQVPRTRAHLEKGLELAERCLAWRAELKKGPGPFSMAYWVRGMHRLSLGAFAEAQEDFAQSLDCAVKAAQGEGQASECKPGAAFAVILGHGYLGLARTMLGTAGGAELYQEALDTFAQTIEQFPDQKDDAQFGIDQLRQARVRVECRG